MSRIRIKICGITQITDAQYAAELGADAIGLIFHPESPRAVNVTQAAAIVQALPPFVDAVGVFLNAATEQVQQVLDKVALTYLQFHGAEDAQYCQQFRRPYIKTIAMREALDYHTTVIQHPRAAAFLLDTEHQGKTGGTGRCFDWSLFKNSVSKQPIILAGGLTPENVRKGIETVKPYAVDVASGVESSPGKKDHQKLKQFILMCQHFTGH